MQVTHGLARFRRDQFAAAKVRCREVLATSLGQARTMVFVRATYYDDRCDVKIFLRMRFIRRAS